MFNKKKIASAIALSAIGASALTVAPVVTAEGITLEEIVVTAQKREQNLQEVPVAITAFSGVELEEKGLGSVVDLEKSSPNTQMRASRATSSTLTAYVRGVGQQDPLWGFEPGVGVYVDDVYYARPQAAAMDVFDVERIEVLRGPQGTLYGKNTVGGAVKYVTRKMTGDANGAAKLTVGSYGQQDVMLSGQLPIIQDQLYIGAAVAKLDRDGFGETQVGFDNDPTSATYGQFLDSVENYNKDVLVYRVSAEYNPSEDLFFRVAYDKTDDESNQRCGSMTNATSLINPGTGELFTSPGDEYDGQCGTTHESNVENEGFSLTAEYDLSEEIKLKYVFAQREGETQQYIDFESTPLDAFDVPAGYEDDQTTHELQVNYETDFVKLVGGLYYFEGNSAGAFDVVLNGASPLDGTHTDLAIGGDVDTESLSAYVNASFNLTDSLTLTAGARVTQDEKDSNIQYFAYSTSNSFIYSTSQGSGFVHGNPADDTLLAVNSDISDDEANEDWNQVSPSVKLDWKATDDIMLYISYAEGFKSGGFDMRGNAAANPTVAEGYDPETVDTFEIGIKTQLLDDRLRLNITGFMMDYEDLQVTVQSTYFDPILMTDTFISGVVNAGKSEIDGFEIEAIAQLTESLGATFSAGYLNAEYVEIINAGVNVADSWEMPNTPQWTSQLGLNYDADLGDAGTLALNTAVSYRDASGHFANTTCSCDQTTGYTVWDAAANWKSADDIWALSLYLKNITDRRYLTGGYNLGSGELGFYSDPRTIQLSLGYKF